MVTAAADLQRHRLDLPSLGAVIREQGQRQIQPPANGPARPLHGNTGRGERRLRPQGELSLAQPDDKIAGRASPGKGKLIREAGQPFRREPSNREVDPIVRRIHRLQVAGGLVNLEWLQRLHGGGRSGAGQGGSQPIDPEGFPGPDQVKIGFQLRGSQAPQKRRHHIQLAQGAVQVAQCMQPR